MTYFNYVVVLVTVTGIVILAPLSLPTICKVVLSEVLEPNNESIVVAVKLIVVPTTVLDTLVPIVWVEFKFWACSVLIPTPLNSLNNLTSAIVAV